MAGDHTANVREADASPFEISGAMEALKDPEQLVRIARVEADAIIADKDNVLGLARAATDFNPSILARAGVLDRVTQQIDEDLAKQSRVRFDLGQF